MGSSGAFRLRACVIWNWWGARFILSTHGYRFRVQLYLFLQWIGPNAIVQRLIVAAGKVFAWIVSVSHPHQSPWTGGEIVRQRWQNYFQLLFGNLRFVAEGAAQPDRLLFHVVLDQIELFVWHEIEFQHTQRLMLRLIRYGIGQRERDITGEFKSSMPRQTNHRRLFRCARLVCALLLEQTVLTCVDASEQTRRQEIWHFVRGIFTVAKEKRIRLIDTVKAIASLSPLTLTTRMSAATLAQCRDKWISFRWFRHPLPAADIDSRIFLRTLWSISPSRESLPRAHAWCRALSISFSGIALSEGVQSSTWHRRKSVSRKYFRDENSTPSVSSLDYWPIEKRTRTVTIINEHLECRLDAYHFGNVSDAAHGFQRFIDILNDGRIFYGQNVFLDFFRVQHF